MNHGLSPEGSEKPLHRLKAWLIRHKLFPASLAARTSLLLIAGFAVIEITGLSIEAMDRMDFDNRLAAHRALTQVMMAFRTLQETDTRDRESQVQDLQLPEDFTVHLAEKPDPDMTREVSPAEFRHMFFSPGDFGAHGPPPFFQRFPFGNGPSPDHPAPFLPGPPGPDHFCTPPGQPETVLRSPRSESSALMRCGPPFEPHPPPFAFARWHPQRIFVLPDEDSRKKGIALQLQNDIRWLVVRYRLPVPTPFSSPTFPIAFGLMTLGGCVLIVWAMRRMIAPVGTLAAAAAAFTPDTSSAPLPQNGPTEIARAAGAFNAMAARIRRFVSDRTHLLTAIGHDLRTPITRLRLRTEFIDDEEMRQKFLTDLNELSAMVEATLDFGRDSSSREAVTPVNLTALLSTVVDDVAESRPESADRIILAGDPPPIIIRGRPLGLKRAFTNLVNNAVIYGGSAVVTVTPPKNGRVTVLVEDEGQGLSPENLERMFEPFVRAEESRNRETGGTGLGLPITRTIIRGLGGDVMLHNRKPHGLQAKVTLVA